jgi:hypothetical protein
MLFALGLAVTVVGWALLSLRDAPTEPPCTRLRRPETSTTTSSPAATQRDPFPDVFTVDTTLPRALRRPDVVSSASRSER